MRFAVETSKRLFTFDTFDEASRFADNEVSSGHSVISIYRPDLLGPIQNAAERFAAGRGALTVREVSEFLRRGHSYVYGLIGRGELRQIGPGRITADSLTEFYGRYEKKQEVPCELNL